MKLITGKVVDGRIEFPPGEIEEGATVGIVAFDDDEPVVLTESEEQQITEALEAIARGEYVDGDEFLAQLKARRPA